jgi:uncharacterized membrane protein
MRSRFIACCLVMIAAVCAVTGYFWPTLPEYIPLHWNYAGEVDSYEPRELLWLLGPGLMTIMMLIALLMPHFSPRRFEIKTFESTWWYSMTIIVAMPAYISTLVLISALGREVAMKQALPAGLFTMMILLGNPLGKVRKNFFLGVRTPWTLSNDRVWYATHRLTAKLMVISGVLGLAGLLLGVANWILVALLFGWALVAVIFSLVYYKRLERSGNLEPR